MNQHRLIETSDTLIGAFIQQKLIHGKPCGCAVGNLCQGDPYWINTINGTHQNIDYKLARYIPEYVRYTPEEIMKIEFEFEGRVRVEAGWFPPTLYSSLDHFMN